MAILIKRYANRKLYDTQASRYITLKGIAELIDQGEEVQVIDNETGEDITSVTLSQILVDSERSNSEVPQPLLSQLFERGGDVLYSALRRRVDEATEGFEEFQDRMRRMVHSAEATANRAREGFGGRQGAGGEGEAKAEATHRWKDWIAYASPDFDRVVQKAVERVFEVLDLPRRADIETLNKNLEQVRRSLEDVESRLASHEAERSRADEADPS